VAVTYRTPPAAAPAANASVHVCDLARAESRAALVAKLRSAGGGLDAVVVLAGAILGTNLEATTDEAMDRLVASNLTGPARLLRDLLPVLNRGARVLLLSSIAGERGSFDPLYAATKGALIPFAKSLATWAGDRLTVTVVAPGGIEDSAMVRGMGDARAQHHRQATPTGELLGKADLARILVDLAHPHWRHANGAVIRVNGGAYV
jgi:3-oxoacyl-[acyl-carrier protein] reductase